MGNRRRKHAAAARAGGPGTNDPPDSGDADADAGASSSAVHPPSSGRRERPACSNARVMRIPYHNKADGFTAALVLALNQVRWCELHGCYPVIQWGAFPACKYAGVRFPGRTPFYDAAAGPNAFEYYFRPACAGTPPPQQTVPQLTCEQREAVHRQLPWSVRTYYYGVDDPKPPPGRNETGACQPTNRPSTGL